MQRKAVLTLALVLCLASSAQAALSIVVGNHTIQAAPNQHVDIMVTGGDQVSGANINAQIGPSAGFNPPAGPSPSLGPGYYVGGPPPGAMTGSIFTSAAATVFDEGSSTFAMTIGVNQNTVTNTISANGLLITLNIDATGWGGTTWDLIMGPANFNDSTNFNNQGNDVPVAVLDGTITVVPEPTSVVLGLFAAAGLGIVAIRRRRARRT